ncbi:MAG: endopeptidase La [Fimbriimonadaceae bacterium]|nr:endopeptidase La [Fimbriimonadaceae bacterium]
MTDIKVDILEEAAADAVAVVEAEESRREEEAPLPETLRLLPLRDSVIFPTLIAPLSVGREAGKRLLDDAVDSGQRIIGVVTQRQAGEEEPGFDDVYPIGCAVHIRTLMKGDDVVRLLVQGVRRFRIVEQIQTSPYLTARVEPILPSPDEEGTDEAIEALKRSIIGLFDQAVSLAPNLPEELRALTANVQEATVLADLIAAHMPFSTDQKQELLGMGDTLPRLRRLVEMLGREVRVLELTSKVTSEVSAELSRSQREHFLREQLKAIQRELGDEDGFGEDIADLESKLDDANLPEEARAAADRELSRLMRINPGSPEYTVCRTYLETLAALPWDHKSQDNLNLEHARAILDEDHFGLDKVKDRIIEFLAVQQLKSSDEMRQPILCFYGPPGVGKTSLGRSISRAMEREFVRLSLGGVRDEAEIRGHRRTYIGSLPGQVIQGIRRAGTSNPVFVLDEVDKLGNDFRGDPASALLEVLDPEQNSTFRDHYLDVPFDLSTVLFIATANRLDTIPPALRDRMEIIELGGYTEQEKVEIAMRHLNGRQMTDHGLVGRGVRIQPDAIRLIARHYTREAGVRNLNREIGSVLRKAAIKYATGFTGRLTVSQKFVKEALGAPRYLHDRVTQRPPTPGVAVGLAWTPVGGDVLFIETVKMPGKGGLVVTGQLGDVMKESATAALSWVRSQAESLKIDPELFEKSSIHIHVPQGAVPKDGPSAGITMVTALVSLLTGRTVKSRLAMTGEVTLTGQVSAIGGVKEKVLAAHRAGVDTVILPEENRKDYMEEVPAEIRAELKVHYVNDVGRVLRLALEG